MRWIRVPYEAPEFKMTHMKPLPDYSVKVVAFLKKQGFRILPDDGEFNLRAPLQPYYVYCYWDNGHNGSYCTEDQVLDTFYDSTSDHDRLYKVLIYSTAEDREVIAKTTVVLE